MTDQISPGTETAFAPGWLSRTLYASHIAVMANYHAGIGPGRAKTPVPDNEAADLFKILDERFKSWTGKSLEGWCAGHAQTPAEPVAWRIAPSDTLFLMGSTITDDSDVAENWRKAGCVVEPLFALSDSSTVGNSK